jgi:hypothetical protein
VKRLMHGKWMNRAANAVFVILVLSFIAINVFDLAYCAPIDHIWKFTPDSKVFFNHLTTGCIFKLRELVIFDAVVNGVSDVLLMILPLPLIWKVRLPLVSFIFSKLISVHQTQSDRSLRSRLCRHRGGRYVRLHGFPSRLYKRRQLHHMV